MKMMMKRFSLFSSMFLLSLSMCVLCINIVQFLNIVYFWQSKNSLIFKNGKIYNLIFQREKDRKVVCLYTVSLSYMYILWLLAYIVRMFVTSFKIFFCKDLESCFSLL